MSNAEEVDMEGDRAKKLYRRRDTVGFCMDEAIRIVCDKESGPFNFTVRQCL